MDGGYVTIAARLIGTTLLLASLSGAVLAQQYPSRADHHRGPLHARRLDRHSGTPRRRGAADRLQAERRGREPHRRRRHHRQRLGRPRAPDGQTLLLAPTAFSIVPFTTKNVPYDAVRDFKPITLLGYTANVMVVSPYAAGEHREGVHRLREVRRQVRDLCVAGPRHADPTRRRGVRAPDRHQDAARAVSRRDAGGHRVDVRRGDHDVPRSCAGHAADRGAASSRRSAC